MVKVSLELRCSAVLFDLDGVLVDSGNAVEASWETWARRHGLDGGHVLGQCHGRRTVETVRAVAPHLDAEREAILLEAEQATQTGGLRACTGAANLLAALGDLPWAVVTSGTRLLALARLAAAGLPRPAVLVAGDDVEQGKPSPEGYLKAATVIGVPAQECVVFEDARRGVQAAREAGARVIGIAGELLGPTADIDLVVGTLAELSVEPGGGSVRFSRVGGNGAPPHSRIG
ncbi:HAD-IA family hydrolase [Polymorphospora rubra]|uniref:HAD-IA family hydrolase n=1 Tax=Polymorphospora rubra TaxID=338584 RepID=UPI0033CD0BB4